MNIKNRKKNTNNRKSFKNTRKSGNISFHYPPYFADLPPVRYAKLQYTDVTHAPDVDAAALSIRAWRANDVYDPDYAVGGHQPFGFDQLIARYQHFTVERSHIDVDIMNTGEYKNAAWVIHLASAAGESSAAYAAGGIAGLVEQPRTSSVAMCGIMGNQTRQRSISFDFSAPTFFRKTLQSMLGSTSYSGSGTAGPGEDAYFEVSLFSPSGLALAFDYTAVRTTLTYWVVFSEPKYMAPSINLQRSTDEKKDSEAFERVRAPSVAPSITSVNSSSSRKTGR